MTHEEKANELMNKFIQEGLPDDLGYRIAIRPYIVEALASAEKKGREEGSKIGMECCARFAVRRMTAWSIEDDKKSHSFREGIEQACSDLAIKFRDGSLSEPWIKELDRAVPYEKLQEMYEFEKRRNVQLQNNLWNEAISAAVRVAEEMGKPLATTSGDSPCYFTVEQISDQINKLKRG